MPPQILPVPPLPFATNLLVVGHLWSGVPVCLNENVTLAPAIVSNAAGLTYSRTALQEQQYQVQIPARLLPIQQAFMLFPSPILPAAFPLQA